MSRNGYRLRDAREAGTAAGDGTFAPGRDGLRDLRGVRCGWKVGRGGGFVRTAGGRGRVLWRVEEGMCEVMAVDAGAYLGRVEV